MSIKPAERVTALRSRCRPLRGLHCLGLLILGLTAELMLRPLRGLYPRATAGGTDLLLRVNAFESV